MTTTRYSVQGLKCAGCIKAATAALEKLPGYQGAEFDLETGRLLLKGDIAQELVARELTDRGYPTTPAED